MTYGMRRWQLLQCVAGWGTWAIYSDVRKDREQKVAGIYVHGDSVLVPRERHDENLGWVRRFLPDSIDRHDTHSSNAQRFQSACLSVCWNPYYKLSTYLYCSGHKVYKTELTLLFYVLSFLLPLLSSLSTSALLRLKGMPLVEALHYKPEGRGFDSRWFTSIFHWLHPSGHKMTLELA